MFTKCSQEVRVARNKPPDEGPSRLVMPRPEFERLLDNQIRQGELLSKKDIRSQSELEDARAEFQRWSDYTRTLLKRSFSSSDEVDRYGHYPIRMGRSGLSLSTKIADFRDDVRALITNLTSLKGQLGLYETPQPEQQAPRHPRSGDELIFVVHGHAGEAREALARFLESLGTSPVILHEQPNSGQTIIEKFERHGSAAGFAVVLLTGDDEGRKRAGGDVQPRARQNVVLELGFFIGTLGRDHTAILYEPGVELPSDLHGLLYIELDAHGGWKHALARELKAAGVTVDLNKAI
jgi:predicted nucleotide-binding protein